MPKAKASKKAAAQTPPILERHNFLLLALQKVMRNTEGPQAIPDVVRRLKARGVPATVSEVLEALAAAQAGRPEQGGGPRLVLDADKRLSWVVEDTEPATQPVRTRKPSLRAVQQDKPASEPPEAAPMPVAEPRGKAAATRKALLKQLLKLTPNEFELLCARVMTAMGVQNVQATPSTNDAGVDVRGVLVIEDLIRIRVAVQVKRYTGNVSRPEVQKLRGSLSHGEVGWFMTTGDYSSGAREEAINTTRQPISLISGLEVADLVLKYSVPLQDEAPA